MRLFLYEHLCASGIVSSLRVEGWAMHSALAEDFQRIAGCEVWTVLDDYCPGPKNGRLKTGPTFRELANQADATLVIAPETGGVLAQLSRMVIESGGRLLGCAPSAVDLTADKKALGELWRRQGILTSALLDMAEFPGFPVVLKPRWGAGSQATFLIHDQQSWQACWREARREFGDAQFVVQPFAPGQPASVAFLLGPAASGIVVPLAPATQRLSEDGRFHYLGGRLPLEPALAQRAVKLGRRAVGCVQGLLGYVGVDLILGAEEQDDLAIEINPRLTTSYLGLRRLLQGNLAEALLNVSLGNAAGELYWQPGPVTF